jgi:hypothetical protein
VTPQVDAAILRVIARIKRGDSELYETSKDIFEGASPAFSFCFGIGVTGHVNEIAQRRNTARLLLD